MVKDKIKKIITLMGVLLRLSLLVGLFVFFTYETVIIIPSCTVSGFIYVGIMVLCIFSLWGTFFKQIRKTSYACFFLFLLLFVGTFLYFPPIVAQHNADKCLDSGQGVWDYEQNMCRQDCWKWDREHGCYKK